MIKTDYLVRIMRQFAESVAQILAKKKLQQPEELQKVLHTAARKLLGFDPNALQMLSAAELKRLMSFDPNAAPEKLKMAARLLQEQSELSGTADDGIKAFCLYMEAYAMDAKVMDAEYREQAAILLPAVLQVEPDAGTYLALFRYYELMGQYGKAEDMLYELRDTDKGSADDVGFGFYRRLQKLDDEVLVAGNLPRDEVEDGLKEFK